MILKVMLSCNHLRGSSGWFLGRVRIHSLGISNNESMFNDQLGCPMKNPHRNYHIYIKVVDKTVEACCQKCHGVHFTGHPVFETNKRMLQWITRSCCSSADYFWNIALRFMDEAHRHHPLSEGGTRSFERESVSWCGILRASSAARRRGIWR